MARQSEKKPLDPPRPGLLRRLAAILYDSLLLLAVLFIATALALFLTGGEAIRPHNPFFTSYLLLIAYLFFAWFWIHGGQTLGMQAWRIRVQQLDGSVITFTQALVRFLCAILSWAPLGAGFLWVLVDKHNMAWHDRVSGTVLVLVAKSR